MSEYLDQPRRTEAEAVEDLTRRRHLARLRELVRRLDSQRDLVRNVSGNSDMERIAGRFGDEVAAIKWALLQIDPLTEGPLRALDSIGKAVK